MTKESEMTRFLSAVTIAALVLMAAPAAAQDAGIPSAELLSEIYTGNATDFGFLTIAFVNKNRAAAR